MSVKGGLAGAAGASGKDGPAAAGGARSWLQWLGVGAKKGAAVIMEDDEFLKKWSGPILLGPIVPAVVSLFIIMIGQVTLNVGTEVCNFPLNIFVQAVIAMCYLFLIIFSWVYLGDVVTLKIPILEAEWTMVTPFTSLKFLMRIYLVLGITVFIIFCVGTGLLRLAAPCVDTAPRTYSLTSFMVSIFWLGWVVVFIMITKIAYGSEIFKFISDAARAPTQNEFEEKIFRKQFSEFDKNKESAIDPNDFPAFLQQIGIYVPDNEQPQLLRTLDPEGTGKLLFDNVHAWFKKINAAGDDVDGGDMDDSEKPVTSPKKTK